MFKFYFLQIQHQQQEVNLGQGILLPFSYCIRIKHWKCRYRFWSFIMAQTTLLRIGKLISCTRLHLYTYTFPGAANILDFAVGGGAYGTIWFSRWSDNQANNE